ncbi:unnamed protein product [Brachionus calyciflorus]|uniref:Coiled-coil domain-containing protein 51 n=1 Tax=Brachionus calyciflorus TaxID=104777 RepID=A0A813NBI7_9BILA|nr:unnamed protein product [Brachionus calyciflorus]
MAHRILTIRKFHFDSKNASNKLSTEAKASLENLNEKLKNKVFEYMSIYEESIGLKEIKLAQQAVLDAEKNFLVAQNERRDLNYRIMETQQKLRDLKNEMDRLARSDSRYFSLFTEEHGLLQTEVKLLEDFKLKESKERDLFYFLSTSLRDAQEKERIRVERTKYLQLGLSILCTSLGILSAFLLSYFRNANIREILTYDREQFENVNYVLSFLNKGQQAISNDINQNLKTLESDLTKYLSQENENNRKVLSENLSTLENVIKNQNELIVEFNESRKIDDTNKIAIPKSVFYSVVITSLAILGSLVFINK